MGTLDTIREAIREKVVDDEDFYKKYIYYFELRIPSEAAPVPFMDTFLFPLALGPESYSMEEPFALEKSYTEGGGLYIEENGIVERMIRLQGTTGFKPRNLKGNGPVVLSAMSPEKKSYGRVLQSWWVLDKLSGQRHFHYLQDVVFRTYADFKRDPATAEDTKLIFHNPKDREHWLVAPQRFSLERRGRNPLYRYNIELLVLAPADDADADFSEDKSLLDSFKDSVRTIKSAIDLASGALNDLTALADEISRSIKNVTSIFDNVATFIDSASNFVEGVTDLIEAPFSLVTSTANMIDSALDLVNTVEDSYEDIAKLPETVNAKLRYLEDAMDLAGTQPQVFRESVESLVETTHQLAELLLSASTSEIETAEASDPPSSLAAFDTLGTAMTPGDIESAKADSSVGRTVRRYTGAQEVEIVKGDSLVSLAAKYLGDARLWQEIALLNGLRPPFIDDQAGADLGGEESPLPGALGIGQKILVPNYRKPPQSMPLLPVLGVIPEKSMAEHLLGTDFAMVATGGSPGREFYDWVVDVAGGSMDAKYARGVDNVKQAYTMRLSTEKGSDVMYSRMGLRRTVGLNIAPVDLETSKFNLIECIKQDPRTASVRRVILESEYDAVIAEMDVELRGFTKPTNVKVVV